MTPRSRILRLSLVPVALLIAQPLLAQSRALANDPDPSQVRNARTTAPQMSTTTQGFPKNARSLNEAIVFVRKEVPTEVRPDQDYAYTMTVTNRSTYQIDEVVVTESLPRFFELSEADPNPEIRGSTLRWTLRPLSPGQQEILTIRGRVTRPGTVQHVGTTDVNFSLGRLTAVINVVEAVLEFTIDNPNAVIISDEIPVTMTFRNSGTAPVEGARLAQNLPEGLTTSNGNERVEVLIGDLQPGQVKTIDMSFRASSVGIYSTEFIASAEDGVTAAAPMRVTVQKPNLTIEAEVPQRRFVGNLIPYEITVTNTGDAIARETVVRQELSPGTSLSSANEGGQLAGNTIIWNLGSLRPGESKTVGARVVAQQIMTARSTASAEAIAASRVSTSMSTDVQGIAALLLQLGDINDPVVLGDTETYIIRAINQGTKAATSVVIKCVLEDSMAYVGAEGPSEAQADGNVVTFAALPRLEPKAEAEWRVIVRAVKPGDVRFSASLEADQLSSPVVENESTNFYE